MCLRGNHLNPLKFSINLFSCWWAYRISRPLSVRPSSTFFKYLLIRNHWADWGQISFGVSMAVGTKICSNNPDHMTEMAAMLIYGENLKISSPEPKGRWPWNLVCSIGCSSTTKFVQMMTLIYDKVKALRALRGKNGPVRKWFISSYVVAYVILITK